MSDLQQATRQLARPWACPHAHGRLCRGLLVRPSQAVNSWGGWQVDRWWCLITGDHQRRCDGVPSSTGTAASSAAQARQCSRQQGGPGGSKTSGPWLPGPVPLVGYATWSLVTRTCTFCGICHLVLGCPDLDLWRGMPPGPWSVQTQSLSRRCSFVALTWKKE